ncbi:MAG: OstA-like protein [candidate division WOR-3 bacterium]
MILLIIIISATPFKADRIEITNEDGERVVYLLGNVEIEQEKTKILCSEAQLNETKKFVLLKDSILIKDGEGEIRANRAIYFFDEKFSVLKENVRLVSENQIISADSLEYYGERRVIKMFRNIILEDKENKVIAYGEEGWYDLNEEIGSLIEGPKLEVDREGNSPIRITAKQFLLKSKENMCYGYDSVIAIIDSITIFCDTISYNVKEKTGMMVKPLVTEKNNKLEGTSGEFALQNQTIDYFKVFSGTGSYWTEEGSHNIIEGESIDILFRDGRAFRIKVEGNPKGKLYLKGEKENAGD